MANVLQQCMAPPVSVGICRPDASPFKWCWFGAVKRVVGSRFPIFAALRNNCRLLLIQFANTHMHLNPHAACRAVHCRGRVRFKVAFFVSACSSSCYFSVISPFFFSSCYFTSCFTFCCSFGSVEKYFQPCIMGYGIRHQRYIDTGR